MQVRFHYSTGLTGKKFRHARLMGSWDVKGHYSDDWTSWPMEATKSEDSSGCFAVVVELDDTQMGRTFKWGVFLEDASSSSVWGIPTETNDQESSKQYRIFVLRNSRHFP